MKYIIAAIILAAALVFVVGCTTGPDGKSHFQMPPVKAKVCYLTPNGSVCAGTDGKAIVLEGNLQTDNVTINVGK